jgi:hypothetical protein
MDKDELLERVKDKKYISGIYNYCDRWCERCQFTSRCLNCTLVEEQFGDLQEKDELNEVFWQRFSEMLHNTLTMVKEMAKERGIDIDSIDFEKNHDNEDPIKENRLTDLISHTSENYAKTVNDWFNSNEYILLEKEDEISRIHPIASQNNPIKEAANINDAIEIIRWYQYQIHIKLKRASESTSRESIDYGDFPKDSDGSAKVALIGIDRSISAWNILLPYFSDQERQILGLIALLENIKTRVEIQFPSARDFIRPGFDEIV